MSTIAATFCAGDQVDVTEAYRHKAANDERDAANLPLMIAPGVVISSGIARGAVAYVVRWRTGWETTLHYGWLRKASKAEGEEK